MHRLPGAAVALVVVLAAPSVVGRTAAERKPPDQAVQRRVHDALLIIEGEEYDKVVKAPFLVSALYYSDKAVGAMEGSKSRPARIVGGIHPHVGHGFRGKYLTWLEGTSRQDRPAAASDALGLPLSKYAYVWKMTSGHRDAIDLLAPESTPVMSMSRGIVLLAENGWRPNDDLSTSSEMGGNTVIVYDPDNRTFLRYAHLSRSTVMAGAVVSIGDPIGTVGHTGKRAMRRGHGKHLHLEMNRWESDTDTITSVRTPELKLILDSMR